MLYSVELRSHPFCVGGANIRRPPRTLQTLFEGGVTFRPVQLEVWTFGRDSEPWVATGVAHYLKRLQPMQRTGWVQLDARASSADPGAVRAAEEKVLLKRLGSGQHLILLDERGDHHTSIEWAGHFEGLRGRSTKSAVVLIGGAYGVTDAVRERADAVWALSRLVFPHGLVRLMLAEQLYRAFSILHGSGYHHA